MVKCEIFKSFRGSAPDPAGGLTVPPPPPRPPAGEGPCCARLILLRKTYQHPFFTFFVLQPDQFLFRCYGPEIYCHVTVTKRWTKILSESLHICTHGADEHACVRASRVQCVCACVCVCVCVCVRVCVCVTMKRKCQTNGKHDKRYQRCSMQVACVCVSQRKEGARRMAGTYKWHQRYFK